MPPVGWMQKRDICAMVLQERGITELGAYYDVLDY